MSFHVIDRKDVTGVSRLIFGGGGGYESNQMVATSGQSVFVMPFLFDGTSWLS